MTEAARPVPAPHPENAPRGGASIDEILTPDRIPVTTLAVHDPEKLRTLLRSRKFWTTVTAAALTVYLYATGELSAEAFADATALIAAVYVGSIALEDGLRGLVAIWTRA